jgi:hypothetical protein
MLFIPYPAMFFKCKKNGKYSDISTENNEDIS